MISDLLSAIRCNNWEEAEHILCGHWLARSPLVFAVKRDQLWDVKWNQTLINHELLHPLASAYCLDENVASDITSLNEQCSVVSDEQDDQNAVVCGHAFAAGEIAYSCTECASDPTCVFCQDCFQNSEHKYHKYRMSASSGNGYCDCGDEEAWHRNPLCNLHVVQQRKLVCSKELQKRISSLTVAVLHFAFRFICWRKNEFPGFLSKETLGQCPESFNAILFNDETHTYDSVIRALNLSIHCDDSQAMRLATIVDREGRAVVCSDSHEQCQRVKEEIQRRTQRDVSRRTEKSGPLEVRVMESSLVAIQTFAIHLISWLNKQCNNFRPLRIAISQSLFSETLLTDNYDITEYEFLEETDNLISIILKCDRHLWKAARYHGHQLLMRTVLMYDEQRMMFARQFVKLYDQLVLDYIDDDHEHSVSILALSVQIFTVPTIARALITDENVLAVIIQTLMEHCQQYLLKPEKLRFDFTTRTFPNVLRRALNVFNDYRYLLSIVPKSEHWSTALRTKFLLGSYSFIRFLRCMQNMDEVQRKTFEHQTYELEWETAFNIQIRVQRSIFLTISWACSDQNVHKALLKHLLNTLHTQWSNDLYFPKKSEVEVYGQRAMCIPYDVSHAEISFHQPLIRLFAGLFTAPQQFLENIIASPDHPSRADDDTIDLAGKRALLCEMPLRVLVVCSQYQAHMWRRNGNSFANQVHNYFAPLCRSEMFDRDILMLQVGASLTPPNTFMIRLLQKFVLTQWAMVGYENRQFSAQMDELSKQTVTLAEEMLHLIIIIIGERYILGVGKVNNSAKLRREILHLLATGPKPFSALQDAFHWNSAVEIEIAANSVGEFRAPNDTTPGIFIMKTSVASEFNPFYYHYSKAKFSEAHHYQRQRRADLDSHLQACAPPVPPPFEPFFAPITELLRCNVLVFLIHIILQRTIKRSRFSSDGMLHRTLFLIGMGLNEQKICKDFDFVSRAENLKVFQLLEQLVDKPEAKQNAQLLDWVIHTYNKIKEDITGIDTMKETRQVSSNDANLIARKATAARMRKQALLQMNRMQEKFLERNMESIEKESEKLDEKERQELELEEYSFISTVNDGFPVCLGKDRSPVNFSRRVMHCILCKESSEIMFDGKPVVLTAHIQRSTLFHRRAMETKDGDFEILDSLLFMPSNVPCGLNISTCGHAMHFSCFEHFSELYKNRERSRPTQRVFNILSGEYLCPLCKRICNTAMPVFPVPSLLQKAFRFGTFRKDSPSFEEWVSSMVKDSFDCWIPAVKKGHSRKRSHSEKSLNDLPKEISRNIKSTSSLTNSRDRMNQEVLMDIDAHETLELHHQAAISRQLSLLPSVVQKLMDIVQQKSKIDDENLPPTFTSHSWQMVKSFLNTVGERAVSNPKKLPYITGLTEVILSWQMVSYTLRSICAVLRHENKPLFGAFTTRQRESLYYVSRVSAVSAFRLHPEKLCHIFSNLMAPLLFDFHSCGYVPLKSEFSLLKSPILEQSNEQKLSSASTLDGDATRSFNMSNISAIDMLSLAIELAMCSGWSWYKQSENGSGKFFVVPDGCLDEHYCVRLALIGFLFQVFASFDNAGELILSNSKQQQNDCDQRSRELISYLYSVIYPNRTIICIGLLFEALKSAVVEFLRPLALLYHSLTLVPPPEALKDPSIHEFEPLCRYMGFSPSLYDFLAGATVEKCFKQWSQNQKHIPFVKLTHQPIQVNSLIDLPHEFSVLINKAAGFRCPSSLQRDHGSAAPTLCLICGELLCSQSYCCQRTVNQSTYGACNYHLLRCSGPSGGIYLRIRDCQVILLLASLRGAYLNAPYVDEYGETDFGFRRGLPLRLNLEHYAQLKKLWLNQSIVEKVVDLHEVEHRGDNFGWELV